MNKKGFMMAELVVVSSIIVITLTGLYISYNKIITSYRQIISYYDIGFYYKLGYYNKKLDKAGTLTDKLASIDDGKYSDISSVSEPETDTKEIIYIIKNKSAITTLKNEIENEIENGKKYEKQKYKDYLEYLYNSKNLGNEYYIIGEKCQTANENKCVYAYAEVAK